MRPIVMDMNGFGSFREQTQVDFTDADFFALVGPTGAGKSTVIDAMTFALYGSVPRWADRRLVSLALAPTVTRATVKLVFEVGRQRYVIARELRRVGGQVSQRAASIERILDSSGLAQPGDSTEPMARDLAGVRAAVERLLGLSYEDFIQCVVLPQGQFADFLHAKPSDRQEILLRLLGAEHYKQMMMRANQRASAAAQHAQTLGESLFSYADATEEAEQNSRAAEAALATLADHVVQTLPRIAESQAALSAAESRLQQLSTEHSALAAVQVPDDVTALDTNLLASRADVVRLKGAEQEAESVDTDARASLATGPQRAPLELARDRRGERNRLQGGIPGLEEDVRRLTAASEAASAVVEKASTALEDRRSRRDKAASEATAAGDLVERLDNEHATLASVSVPDGVTKLDERRQAAALAVAEAAQVLADAERTDRAAREERDNAIPEAPLAQASRDLHDLQELLPDLEIAGCAAEQASVARRTSDDELAHAVEALGEQREALDNARNAHIIAGLRPHLLAGEDCPLCEQTVTALPGPVPAPEVDDAQTRLHTADRAVAEARIAASNALATAERADADLRAKLDHRTRLRNSLSVVLNGPLGGLSLPVLQAIMTSHGLAAGAEGLVERAAA
jgi:DNA repair protein SbcC/Rad50